MKKQTTSQRRVSVSSRRSIDVPKTLMFFLIYFLSFFSNTSVKVTHETSNEIYRFSQPYRAMIFAKHWASNTEFVSESEGVTDQIMFIFEDY